ncbi:MAG: DUF4251 domain-containing protein [Arenibacter sp.]|nr:DUF4251 domain-containing protein [Arenibacter sp.]
MKSFKYFVLLGMMAGLFWSCGSTQSAADIALKDRQFGELKELVASKSYAIDVKTAHPMQTYAVTRVTNSLMRNTGNNSGRIDVAGNFINIREDEVEGGLAYYGEVRIANTLDPRDNGIIFKGEPLSYEVLEDEKKQTLKVEFDIKGNSMELFTIIMQLYPSKRASIIINSPNRNSIRYEGNLRAFDANVSSK